MIPKFRIADKRGDVVIVANVSSIDWIARQVQYINEYNEEESCFFDDEDCILMQSTGLKDKNGVDLDWYAGDIIQKGEIVRAITVDWEHGMRFMLGKHILCKQDGVHGVRIGNIHANPELLEAQE